MCPHSKRSLGFFLIVFFIFFRDHWKKSDHLKYQSSLRINSSEMLSIKDGDVPQPRSGRFVHNDERKKWRSNNELLTLIPGMCLTKKLSCFNFWWNIHGFPPQVQAGSIAVHCRSLYINQEKPWKTLENQSKLGNLMQSGCCSDFGTSIWDRRTSQNNTKYTSVPLPPRVSFTSGIVPTTGRWLVHVETVVSWWTSHCADECRIGPTWTDYVSPTLSMWECHGMSTSPAPNLTTGPGIFQAFSLWHVV
jgi:hypothetical protein